MKVQQYPIDTQLEFAANSRISYTLEMPFSFENNDSCWSTFFTFGRKKKNFRIDDGIIYAIVKSLPNGDLVNNFKLSPNNLFLEDHKVESGWKFELNKINNIETYQLKFYAIRFDLNNNGEEPQHPNEWPKK